MMKHYSSIEALTLDCISFAGYEVIEGGSDLVNKQDIPDETQCYNFLISYQGH